MVDESTPQEFRLLVHFGGWEEAMLFQYLVKTVVRKGTLKIISANGRVCEAGDGTGPRVGIRLHRKSLGWSLVFNPDLKIGEAYVDGTLTIEEGDLYTFIDMLLTNYAETGDSSPFHWREYIFPLVWWAAQFNPIGRARRNASFHYDMPDALYRYFLDKDRQYSCGYFADKDEGLERAQLAKKTHVASKLLLNREGLKILDIGSGWGGLGLYLARKAGAIVKGVTLSTNQFRISNERAAAEGLARRCFFALKDYRHEEGPYDRIVSVGMFEHVGRKSFNEYFAQIDRLLRDEGVALIHSIGRFGEPRPINSFIRKYIFPGADIPSLSEVAKAVERSGLFVTDVEILRTHYADTLRLWMQRFRAHRKAIVAEFGEKVFRKWEFYFLGCEAAFRTGGLMVFQLQLTKRHETLPLTRDYMVDWERAQETDAGLLDACVERRASAAGAALREGGEGLSLRAALD
jgi:cyclopropane-fatty-acyl-phospholipid synthase